MEENQTEVTYTTKQECLCKEHPVLKALGIVALIFAGPFCAFYVVTDWHMKSLIGNDFSRDIRAMDRAMQRDIRSMNNMLENKKKFTAKQPGVIHLEQGQDEYKIMIDLRAFDNNENNIQVLTNGNTLTINGRSIRKSKYDEQISEFQQSYLFGSNVKLFNLEKETKGHYLIISIPINNNEND